MRAGLGDRGRARSRRRSRPAARRAARPTSTGSARCCTRRWSARRSSAAAPRPSEVVAGLEPADRRDRRARVSSRSRAPVRARRRPRRGRLGGTRQGRRDADHRGADARTRAVARAAGAEDQPRRRLVARRVVAGHPARRIATRRVVLGGSRRRISASPTASLAGDRREPDGVGQHRHRSRAVGAALAGYRRGSGSSAKGRLDYGPSARSAEVVRQIEKGEIVSSGNLHHGQATAARAAMLGEHPLTFGPIVDAATRADRRAAARASRGRRAEPREEAGRAVVRADRRRRRRRGARGVADREVDERRANLAGRGRQHARRRVAEGQRVGAQGAAQARSRRPSRLVAAATVPATTAVAVVAAATRTSRSTCPTTPTTPARRST